MDVVAVFVILIVFVFIIPWQLYKYRKRLTAINKNLASTEGRLAATLGQLNSVKSELKELHEKAESLWQYQGIHDTSLEAQKIRDRAEENAKSIKSEADRYKERQNQATEQELKQAKEEAAIIRKTAKERSDKAEQKAVETVQLAQRQAETLIQTSTQKAEEIAGDALDAKQNADSYTKTATAMKNLINGYGDEYLIPNHSTLDNLAEEYSHKEAGQELKAARVHTRAMIKSNTAADCDYVEPYRRRTAIEFVLDAFNGKVDTVLTKVRHDNYGKLKQEILDGLQTVNHNGGAFRSARITDAYLSSRLDELKWAVATNELKLQEREEQRKIKEQIREEERARKEYEKAIREAEREEKMLQKAMQKARKELQAANDEQRLALESKLDNLSLQLADAEAKNQRALSMAQQTRRGHVYVISNVGSFGDQVFKIGMTRRLEPMDRVKELGDASVPFGFDVHAIISCEDAPALERELHKRFNDNRVNKVNTRKEFFRSSAQDVRSIVEDLGVETQWTMKAEAREYRETVAMEKQVASLEVVPV